MIRSLNDDKPYDQFVREQLAGDELDEVTVETITATGFYRLGIWRRLASRWRTGPVDELDDIITTISQVFLGLTINCATLSRPQDRSDSPDRLLPHGFVFVSDVEPYDSKVLTSITTFLRLIVRDKLLADPGNYRMDCELHLVEQRGIVKMSAEDQQTEGRQRKQICATRSRTICRTRIGSCGYR